MSDRSPVFVLHRPTRKLIEAELIDGVSKAEAEAANASWRVAMDKAVARLKALGTPQNQMPQHSHWDWMKKFDAVAGLVSFRVLGVEADGAMQGMALMALDGHFGQLQEHKGKPLVYVHYLASAPWNSPRVVTAPEFSLIGRILIAAAIQLSQAEEFSGRIALHALPQSESWYRTICGMTDLGPDPSDRAQLHYFEMTSEQATAFLK